MGPVVVNGIEGKTGHEKFVEQLNNATKEFHPERMSKQEAIMKVFEEQGLNPAFLKNPAAMEKISEIGTDILDREGIGRITSSNLEDVKSKLKNTYGIKISENGDISYQKTKEGILSLIRISMGESGGLEEENWTKSELSGGESYTSRRKNTYNEYGLQMTEEYDSTYLDKDNNIITTKGESYKVERNTANLAFGTYTQQKFANNITWKRGEEPRLSTVHNPPEDTVSYTQCVQGAGDKLGGSRPMTYENASKMKANEIEAYHDMIKKPDGTIKTSGEIAEEFAKSSKSKAFRDTAENMGLIEKSQEIE